jgi:predicted transcriptional regulator
LQELHLMSISQSDIDNFHSFATQELPHCGPGQQLEDLARKWQLQREQEETIASIRRGVADAEAGRVHSLADVDERIRTELGLPACR